MKGYIKNLAVLPIIAVIAPFILSGTLASAQPTPRFIHGHYAANGVHSCLVAICGFTDNVPISNTGTPPMWSQNLSYHRDVYTFLANGTGNASGTVLTQTYVPVDPAINPYFWSYTWACTFTYSITPTTGALTITVPPGSFTYTTITGPLATIPPTTSTLNPPPSGTSMVWPGNVSADGHTILLTLGVDPVGLATISPNLGNCGTSQLQCAGSLVLQLM